METSSTIAAAPGREQSERAVSPSLAISLAGLAAAAFALAFAREAGMVRIEAALLVCAAYAVTVIALEVALLRTPFAPSAGLDFSRRAFSLRRTATKLCGLYAVFGVLAFLYWLFPEYRGQTYQPAFVVATQLAPVVMLLAIPYVAFVDSVMRRPEDGLYLFGRLILGERERAQSPELRQFLLGWAVKGFFTPIMFGALANNTESMLRMSLDVASMSFQQIYALATVSLFWIDVMVACVGYCCAFRLFDSHIRSAEPTASGWAICLICYPPFQTVFMAQYLAYSAPNAVKLLADWPMVQMIWGGAALALLAIYTLATLAFGCRFSNITHRGVITSGPYRFTKHPAYLAKNLYWWLVHAPFLTLGTASEIMRYSLLLLGVNLVYYLRARTEERHLSADPDYVAYAEEMNRRGIFAWFGQAFPALQYRKAAPG